jgi:hypothetical protein
MKIKYGFKSFEVKIEDAIFKVKEMDKSELSLKHTAMVDGQFKFRIVDAIKDFFNQSVYGWEGLTNSKTGMKIEYSDEAKENIPFDIKTIVFNKTAEMSALSEDEKKS